MFSYRVKESRDCPDCQAQNQKEQRKIEVS